jgi:hypothetical protein
MTLFKKKPPLKPLDFAAIAISLGITLCTGLTAYAETRSAGQVLIQGSGRTWIFPLDAEEQVAVAGPLGETVVEIQGGRARVLSSPCGNQTCVAAGHIRRQGEWAACLPNKVLIAIEGSDSETLDAAAW